MAIQGVVFPNQKVSAADHAALFELFISDGIISGCGVNSLRNTFTISSGLFVLKGRLIKIVGSEEITIPDNVIPDSGTTTVRLVGYIDLNQVSTKESFQQFKFRLGSVNETLTKDDINTGTGKLYEVEWALLTIDSEGIIKAYEVKIPNAIASGGEGGGSGSLPTFTYMVNGVDRAGDLSYVVPMEQENTAWKYKFLKSGILTFTKFSKSSKLDVFLVGGGGGGNNIAGGGGGYTTTSKNIVPTIGTAYSIVIGEGGTGVSGTNSYGNDGTESTAFGSTAHGGCGAGRARTNNSVSEANWRRGGDGGSAGGQWDQYGDQESPGASNGRGGTDVYDGHPAQTYFPGNGQGTTTSEFGEEGATLYAGGGGGSHGGEVQAGGEGGGGASASPSSNAVAGTPNTGGGGGSAGAASGKTPAAGGSGVVIIRNSRSA